MPCAKTVSRRSKRIKSKSQSHGTSKKLFSSGSRSCKSRHVLSSSCGHTHTRYSSEAKQPQIAPNTVRLPLPEDTTVCKNAFRVAVFFRWNSSVIVETVAYKPAAASSMGNEPKSPKGQPLFAVQYELLAALPKHIVGPTFHQRCARCWERRSVRGYYSDRRIIHRQRTYEQSDDESQQQDASGGKITNHQRQADAWQAADRGRASHRKSTTGTEITWRK